MIMRTVPLIVHCWGRWKGGCLRYAMELNDLHGQAPGQAVEATGNASFALAQCGRHADEALARQMLDAIIGDGSGVECLVVQRGHCRYASPCFDTDRRELSLGGRVLLRFKRTAPNRMAILLAFQEQAWHHRIVNPLRHSAQHRQTLVRQAPQEVRRAVEGGRPSTQSDAESAARPLPQPAQGTRGDLGTSDKVAGATDLRRQGLH